MSLTRTIHQHALYAPENIALINDVGSISYAELDSLVTKTMQTLSNVGCTPGERVGVQVNDQTQGIALYLACLRLGATFVPFHNRWAYENVLQSAVDASVGVVIADEPTASRLSGLQNLPVRIVRSEDVQAEFGRPIATAVSTVEDYPWTANEIQRLMFTSGTNGSRRAVRIRSEQVMAGLTSKVIEFNLDRQSVGIVTGSFAHVSGLDSFLSPILFAGGAVVAVGDFSPHGFLNALRRYEVNKCWLAPTMIRMLVESGDLKASDLNSLRTILTGGEHVDVSLLDRLRSISPAVALVNAWGMTELLGCGTYMLPEDPVFDFGSVGRSSRLLDLKVDAPVGEVGEIRVRGPLVFESYEGPSGPQKAIDEAGWFNTGDLGRLDEQGRVWFSGRKKDLIIRGAENVSPIEIEKVMLGLEGVAQLVVSGAPHPRWGESPVLFVVPEVNTPHEKIIRQASVLAAKKLAAFQRPSAVMFMDSFPINSTGKVLKHELGPLFLRYKGTSRVWSLEKHEIEGALPDLSDPHDVQSGSMPS